MIFTPKLHNKKNQFEKFFLSNFEGYVPLLVLPKGSRSVNITKNSNQTESSYLAIKNKKG